MPVAPGTAGALVGVAIYWAIRFWSPAAQLGVLALVSVVGIWASTRAAEYFGRKDPGQVVIDEVAGQLATLLALSVNALGVAIGFLLFRTFDILKPWPIRRLEALPGGLGIMADDIVAGIIGWLVMQAVLIALPGIT
jgi:phosphatidylglycerophosphatase A